MTEAWRKSWLEDLESAKNAPPEPEPRKTAGMGAGIEMPNGTPEWGGHMQVLLDQRAAEMREVLEQESAKQEAIRKRQAEELEAREKGSREYHERNYYHLMANELDPYGRVRASGRTVLLKVGDRHLFVVPGTEEQVAPFGWDGRWEAPSK